MSSYNLARGLQSKSRRIKMKCRKRLGYEYRGNIGLRATVWFVDAARHAMASLARFADACSAAAAFGANWHVVADQIAALREPLLVVDQRLAGPGASGEIRAPGEAGGPPG